MNCGQICTINGTAGSQEVCVLIHFVLECIFRYSLCSCNHGHLYYSIKYTGVSTSAESSRNSRESSLGRNELDLNTHIKSDLNTSAGNNINKTDEFDLNPKDEFDLNTNPTFYPNTNPKFDLKTTRKLDPKRNLILNMHPSDVITPMTEYVSHDFHLPQWLSVKLIIPITTACIMLILLLKCLKKVVFGSYSATTPQKILEIANHHKLQKSWEEAGNGFQKAAQHFSRQKRAEHDAANNFAEAANCYRKLKHPEFTLKAVQCLEKAARIYAEIGQFSIAARHLEEAGDLIAQASGVDNNSREAIRLYQKAADYWNSEESPASAADSRSKAAHVMGDMGSVEMLTNAAKEFEDLGVSSQRHALLAFGAKDHMLKACLSQLCVNPSSCPELADDLARKCDSFAESDEQTLVKKLSAACDAGDTVAFDNAVTEFERFNNLDDWSRRRLVVLRSRIDNGGPDLM